MSRAAVWHEVECGGYAADLPVWERLADDAAGPVLELGCGTGRVALRLAGGGTEIWAVDADASLVEALRARATAQGLSVHTAVCRRSRPGPGPRLRADPGPDAAPPDARVGERAPCGAGASGRPPGARGPLAAAIVEATPASLDGPRAAIPDVRELDGWVYSSLPVARLTGGGDLEIHRHRQAVSPEGALSEEEHVDRLAALNADALEAEGATAGLRPGGRLEVPPADGYLGSTVVILERP